MTVEKGWILQVDEKHGTYFKKPEIKDDRSNLEFMKSSKLEYLNKSFELAMDDAYITSSLGFMINANHRSYINICMLIDMIGKKSITVDFCDYMDEFHKLNKKELTVLKNEIAINNSELYKQKWKIKNYINSCNDIDEVEKIEIPRFIYCNFNK